MKTIMFVVAMLLVVVAVAIGSAALQREFDSRIAASLREGAEPSGSDRKKVYPYFTPPGSVTVVSIAELHRMREAAEKR